MAYKVIILYRLYMPSYVLGTFTEYPWLSKKRRTATVYKLVCSPLFVLFLKPGSIHQISVCYLLVQLFTLFRVYFLYKLSRNSTPKGMRLYNSIC